MIKRKYIFVSYQLVCTYVLLYTGNKYIIAFFAIKINKLPPFVSLNSSHYFIVPRHYYSPLIALFVIHYQEEGGMEKLYFFFFIAT